MNSSVRRVMVESTGLMMSISIVLSLLLINGSDRSVSAAWEKNQTNTDLGTRQMTDPYCPDSDTLVTCPWYGSYVYFGKYDEKPIKFRALDPVGYFYGGAALFLDSDEVLFKHPFDNGGLQDWDLSDLKIYLNDQFYNNSFTEAEREGILNSQIRGAEAYPADYADYNLDYSWNRLYYKQTVGLSGQKIFVLDADEATFPHYGYNNRSGWHMLFTWNNQEVKTYEVTSRLKSKTDYWLRAASSGNSKAAGLVAYNGALGADDVGKSLGVAPALNVKMDSIMFSSLISGLAGEYGCEYKLTLRNDDLGVGIPSNEKTLLDGKTLSVPYELSGTNGAKANRISLMILDNKYRAGVQYSTKMLFYAPLEWVYESSGALKDKGIGKIELPSDLNLDKWGTDYHVYIVAEEVNGIKETDYAGKPVELSKPEVKKDDPSVVTATPTPTTRPVTPTPVRPTATPTANPGTSSNVSLTLDRSQAYLVCGKELKLNATKTGATADVTWKSSDSSVASVDGNGLVKGKMAGTVTITASVADKTAKCTVTVLYKDVTDRSKFWFEPTNYLTAKGVVKGYEKQTLFKPANDCTRAQMVTFLWRLQGEPEPQSSTCKFTDVQKTDYFYKACIWGNEKGIVEGYKDGTFGPQIVCARKHAVTFLWRMAGKPAPRTTTNRFSDVRSSDYFYKATLWASETGILAGYDDGTFRPDGDCLRRQMVTFLYKYDKIVNGN